MTLQSSYSTQQFKHASRISLLLVSLRSKRIVLERSLLFYEHKLGRLTLSLPPSWASSVTDYRYHLCSSNVLTALPSRPHGKGHVKFNPISCTDMFSSDFRLNIYDDHIDGFNFQVVYLKYKMCFQLQPTQKRFFHI